VGGDWYDAFELSDGSLLFAIGDVAGHGLAAATTMVQLRNMLRAYAFEVMDPTVVLERLDTILGETGSDQFATCFVARFDPVSRVLTSASAGHPAPIVVSPNRPVHQLPLTPAPMLGARGNQHEQTAWMPPGTRLLCFTDGLVERRSTPIDEGVARVLATVEEARALALDALCDRLVTATADVERSDDVCLLGIDLGRGRRLRFPGPRRRGRRG
jgi:serine phosphatase RsbU (regulator of sigma subunit)